MPNNVTTFDKIYECFFSKITDDMYLEITPEETYDLVSEYFKSALPFFEFPKVDIYDFDEGIGEYNIELSEEEINIIATYMVVAWIGQQTANIENTRMKYSGSDFSFTSQANHLSRLIQLRKHYIETGFHLQRLYGRRTKNEKGEIVPTLGSINKLYED